MKSSPRLAALLAAGLVAASAQAQLTSRPAASAARFAVPPAGPAGPAAPAQPSVESEKEKLGRLTAHGWLVLLDRRDWGTAWDSASGVFRRNVPLDKWMDAVPQLRVPFGALVDRRPVETAYKSALPNQPAGDYVTVIFLSKFEKKAEVQEIVTTMRESDGRWRVTGYSTR